MKRTLLFLLLGLTLFHGESRASVCDSTRISLFYKQEYEPPSPPREGGQTFYYPASVESATVVSSPYNWAGFDHHNGKLYGRACCNWPTAFLVEVWETYRIEGVAGSSPIPITVSLSAALGPVSIYCGFNFQY